MAVEQPAWQRPSPEQPLRADLDVGIVRPFLSAGVVAALVALFVLNGRVREGETALSTLVARGLGVSDARQLGTSVLFTVDGQLTGYTLTLGCTVAFLVVPFFAATGALLAIRRVAVVRALGALAAAVATVLVVNQLRMGVIAVAMASLGAARGYSLTHVLVGTAISTLGVVAAGAIYLVVLVRGTSPRRPEPVADLGVRRG